MKTLATQLFQALNYTGEQIAVMSSLGFSVSSVNYTGKDSVTLSVREVGVSFTEAQKELIKSLVEAGKKAEAQKIMLAAMNKAFGDEEETVRV